LLAASSSDFDSCVYDFVLIQIWSPASVDESDPIMRQIAPRIKSLDEINEAENAANKLLKVTTESRENFDLNKHCDDFLFAGQDHAGPAAA
jgi:hypothetical protein